MAVPVNPPPQVRMPKKFFDDPEVRKYLERLQIIIFQLYNRTGGADDSISDIETSQSFEQGIQFPDEDDSDPVAPQAIQGIKEWRSLSTNISITAHGYDFIAATSALTVKLPEFPDWDDIVGIVNVNGNRIITDGNGKLINGESTTTSFRKNTTINYHYFHELDAWYMR